MASGAKPEMRLGRRPSDIKRVRVREDVRIEVCADEGQRNERLSWDLDVEQSGVVVGVEVEHAHPRFVSSALFDRRCQWLLDEDVLPRLQRLASELEV